MSINMETNTSKTKIMVVKKKTRKSLRRAKFGNLVIKRSKNAMSTNTLELLLNLMVPAVLMLI